jgi:hypothetical protein
MLPGRFVLGSLLLFRVALGVGRCLAGPAPASGVLREKEMAEAIRVYFHRGPAAALELLAPLASSSPGSDVAWWAARCHVDLDQGALALERLRGLEEAVERTGGPEAWRVSALRAEALLLEGRAGESGAALAAALDRAPASLEDPLLRQLLAMDAAVALEEGNPARVLARLLELGGALPVGDLPLSLQRRLVALEDLRVARLNGGLRLPCDLWFRADASDWRVGAEGLLATRGSRHALDSPFMEDEGGGYAGGGAGKPGERLLSTPPGALDLSFRPARGRGGEAYVFFVRHEAGRSRLMRQGPDGLESLAPGLQALGGIAVLRDLLVVSAVVGGRPSLWHLSVDASPGEAARPLFEDPLDAWDPSPDPGCGDRP